MERIAFDVDGVLAKGLDINELYCGGGDGVYRDLMFDNLCLPLLEGLRGNSMIYILTARHSCHRDVTVEWLEKYGVFYDKLFLESVEKPLDR